MERGKYEDSRASYEAKNEMAVRGDKGVSIRRLQHIGIANGRITKTVYMSETKGRRGMGRARVRRKNRMRERGDEGRCVSTRKEWQVWPLYSTLLKQKQTSRHDLFIYWNCSGKVATPAA